MGLDMVSGKLTIVRSAPPRAEKIPDTDADQRDQATAADTLDHTPDDQHGRVDSQGRYQRPDEEDDIRDDENRLATENVTDLAPYWR